MLFTPEMSGLLDRDAKRASTRARSEEDDGVLAACRDAVRQHGLWTHLGSLAVRGPGGKLANRGFLVDPSGTVRARYDKIHLFDVDLPTGESWRESAVYDAGEGAVVAGGTPVGRLGLTICERFALPDLFRGSLKRVRKPSPCPPHSRFRPGARTGRFCFRARAIEAGCFIVAAAQSGHHADGRQTYGHSMVVSPWGEVLLDMGQTTGVGFADIELSLVAEVRQRIPVLAHRRPIAAATLVQ